MTKRIPLLTLGLLLIPWATIACTSTGVRSEKVDRSADEAELRAVDLAWSKAAGTKDVDAIVDFMAFDGETLAPNEPAARDRAAIRASWANLMSLPNVALRWEPLRVQVAESGELGFVSGSYTLSFDDADGRPVHGRGKYLEVWKKVEGEWKCLMDSYNSDLPLQ